MLAGKRGPMDHKHRERRTPGWLARAVATVEDAAVLDHARPLVARLAGPLTRRAALHDVLAGVPTGHPLHPLLAAAVPTVLSGLVEWEPRRVPAS